MAKNENTSPDQGFKSNDNITLATLDLEALYLLLKQRVPNWVYSYNVPAWKGQESDVVNDVIQEGITRTWMYVKRAERGEVAPIESVEHLCVTIAQHYCLDLWRKEKRLMRPNVDDRAYVDFVIHAGGIDATDTATEEIDNERFFGDVSVAVRSIPAKQREALFTDLAQLMHFGSEPTPLQRSFQMRGIELRDYQGGKPADAIGRSRHSALLHLAYQRLKRIIRASSYGGLSFEEQGFAVSASHPSVTSKVPEDELPTQPEVKCVEVSTTSKIPEDELPMQLEVKCVEVSTKRSMTNSPQHIVQILGVMDYVDVLSEPYRTAIRLHYLENQSYDEIAKLLDLPEGTVKSHVSRGRKMLERIKLQSVETSEVRAEYAENSIEVTVYVSKLPEIYQRAIYLHDIKKRSFQEIAQLLDLPEGTVKSHVSRGRKMLEVLRRQGNMA